MQLGEPSQLVLAVHGGVWDRARLAHLAVDVVRAADEGDGVAAEIVSQQVSDLAGCVAAVITALALPPDSVPLALTGGLLVEAPTYRDRLLSELARRGIRPVHVLAVSEPAEGALRLAAARLQASKG
jgi:N-acetylglucosamine kinase-like BadF-type ATPase